MNWISCLKFDLKMLQAQPSGRILGYWFRKTISTFLFLCLGWGWVEGYQPSKGWMAKEMPSSSIGSWNNGRYQLCTELEPQDWRDGAGVCAVFSKMDRRWDGYFGYPHSDRFICLRGMVVEDLFRGQALTLTWVDSQNPSLASLEKDWQMEERIHVQQAKILRTEPAEDGWVVWVKFEKVTLDLKGMHRYAKAKMRSPSELCNW